MLHSMWRVVWFARFDKVPRGHYGSRHSFKWLSTWICHCHLSSLPLHLTPPPPHQRVRGLCQRGNWYLTHIYLVINTRAVPWTLVLPCWPERWVKSLELAPVGGQLLFNSLVYSCGKFPKQNNINSLYRIVIILVQNMAAIALSCHPPHFHKLLESSFFSLILAKLMLMMTWLDSSRKQPQLLHSQPHSTHTGLIIVWYFEVLNQPFNLHLTLLYLWLRR